MAYREQSDLPAQPAIETDEAKRERLARERRFQLARGATWVAALPSALILLVGVEWPSMSSSLQSTSVVATVLLSLGNLFATGILQRWWD